MVLKNQLSVKLYQHRLDSAIFRLLQLEGYTKPAETMKAIDMPKDNSNVGKKDNESAEAGGDSEGQKKSTYDNEHTITITLELLEKNLKTDFKTGLSISEVKKKAGGIWSELPDSPQEDTRVGQVPEDDVSPCCSGSPPSFASLPMVSTLPMETQALTIFMLGELSQSWWSYQAFSPTTRRTSPAK